MRFYPSYQRHNPNDSLTKQLATIDQASEFDVFEGTKNYGSMKSMIFSTVKLRTSNRAVIIEPFDIVALKACVSLQIEKLRFTTINILYRHMTGAACNCKCGNAVRERIKTAIERLATTKIRIDMTAACRAFGYNRGNPYVINAALLPAKLADNEKANGQSADIIEFTADSPIKTIAEMKRQIITCDVDLLNAPPRNSVVMIVIKDYLLTRILEIKKHKLTPKITMSDLIDKCKLADTERNQRKRMREYIRSILDFWIEKEFIRSYQAEIDSRNKSVTSYKIDL